MENNTNIKLEYMYDGISFKDTKKQKQTILQSTDDKFYHERVLQGDIQITQQPGYYHNENCNENCNTVSQNLSFFSDAIPYGIEFLIEKSQQRCSETSNICYQYNQGELPIDSDDISWDKGKEQLESAEGTLQRMQTKNTINANINDDGNITLMKRLIQRNLLLRLRYQKDINNLQILSKFCEILNQSMDNIRKGILPEYQSNILLKRQYKNVSNSIENISQSTISTKDDDKEFDENICMLPSLEDILKKFYNEKKNIFNIKISMICTKKAQIYILLLCIKNSVPIKDIFTINELEDLQLDDSQNGIGDQQLSTIEELLLLKKYNLGKYSIDWLLDMESQKKLLKKNPRLEYNIYYIKRELLERLPLEYKILDKDERINIWKDYIIYSMNDKRFLFDGECNYVGEEQQLRYQYILYLNKKTDISIFLRWLLYPHPNLLNIFCDKWYKDIKKNTTSNNNVKNILIDTNICCINNNNCRYNITGIFCIHDWISLFNYDNVKKITIDCKSNSFLESINNIYKNINNILLYNLKYIFKDLDIDIRYERWDSKDIIEEDIQYSQKISILKWNKFLYEINKINKNRILNILKSSQNQNKQYEYINEQRTFYADISPTDGSINILPPRNILQSLEDIYNYNYIYNESILEFLPQYETAEYTTNNTLGMQNLKYTKLTIKQLNTLIQRIKNIKKLEIRTYEIDVQRYYKRWKNELNINNIELCGLVSHDIQYIKYNNIEPYSLIELYFIKYINIDTIKNKTCLIDIKSDTISIQTQLIHEEYKLQIYRKTINKIAIKILTVDDIHIVNPIQYIDGKQNEDGYWIMEYPVYDIIWKTKSCILSVDQSYNKNINSNDDILPEYIQLQHNGIYNIVKIDNKYTINTLQCNIEMYTNIESYVINNTVKLELWLLYQGINISGDNIDSGTILEYWDNNNNDIQGILRIECIPCNIEEKSITTLQDLKDDQIEEIQLSTICSWSCTYKQPNTRLCKVKYSLSLTIGKQYNVVAHREIVQTNGYLIQDIIPKQYLCENLEGYKVECYGGNDIVLNTPIQQKVEVLEHSLLIDKGVNLLYNSNTTTTYAVDIRNKNKNINNKINKFLWKPKGIDTNIFLGKLEYINKQRQEQNIQDYNIERIYEQPKKGLFFNKNKIYTIYHGKILHIPIIEDTIEEQKVRRLYQYNCGKEIINDGINIEKINENIQLIILDTNKWVEGRYIIRYFIGKRYIQYYINVLKKSITNKKCKDDYDDILSPGFPSKIQYDINTKQWQINIKYPEPNIFIKVWWNHYIDNDITDYKINTLYKKTKEQIYIEKDTLEQQTKIIKNDTINNNTNIINKNWLFCGCPKDLEPRYQSSPVYYERYPNDIQPYNNIKENIQDNIPMSVKTMNRRDTNMRMNRGMLRCMNIAAPEISTYGQNMTAYDEQSIQDDILLSSSSTMVDIDIYDSTNIEIKKFNNDIKYIYNTIKEPGSLQIGKEVYKEDDMIQYSFKDIPESGIILWFRIYSSKMNSILQWRVCIPALNTKRILINDTSIIEKLSSSPYILNQYTLNWNISQYIEKNDSNDSNDIIIGGNNKEELWKSQQPQIPYDIQLLQQPFNKQNRWDKMDSKEKIKFYKELQGQEQDIYLWLFDKVKWEGWVVPRQKSILQKNTIEYIQLEDIESCNIIWNDVYEFSKLYIWEKQLLWYTIAKTIKDVTILEISFRRQCREIITDTTVIDFDSTVEEDNNTVDKNTVDKNTVSTNNINAVDVNNNSKKNIITDNILEQFTRNYEQRHSVKSNPTKIFVNTQEEEIKKYSTKNVWKERYYYQIHDDIDIYKDEIKEKPLQSELFWQDVAYCLKDIIKNNKGTLRMNNILQSTQILNDKENKYIKKSNEISLEILMIWIFSSWLKNIPQKIERKEKLFIKPSQSSLEEELLQKRTQLQVEYLENDRILTKNSIIMPQRVYICRITIIKLKNEYTKYRLIYQKGKNIEILYTKDDTNDKNITKLYNSNILNSYIQEQDEGPQKSKVYEIPFFFINSGTTKLWGIQLWENNKLISISDTIEYNVGIYIKDEEKEKDWRLLITQEDDNWCINFLKNTDIGREQCIKTIESNDITYPLSKIQYWRIQHSIKLYIDIMNQLEEYGINSIEMYKVSLLWCDIINNDKTIYNSKQKELSQKYIRYCIGQGKQDIGRYQSLKPLFEIDMDKNFYRQEIYNKDNQQNNWQTQSQHHYTCVSKFPLKHQLVIYIEQQKNRQQIESRDQQNVWLKYNKIYYIDNELYNTFQWKYAMSYTQQICAPGICKYLYINNININISNKFIDLIEYINLLNDNNNTIVIETNTMNKIMIEILQPQIFLLIKESLNKEYIPYEWYKHFINLCKYIKDILYTILYTIEQDTDTYNKCNILYNEFNELLPSLDTTIYYNIKNITCKNNSMLQQDISNEKDAIKIRTNTMKDLTVSIYAFSIEEFFNQYPFLNNTIFLTDICLKPCWSTTLTTTSTNNIKNNNNNIRNEIVNIPKNYLCNDSYIQIIDENGNTIKGEYNWSGKYNIEIDIQNHIITVTNTKDTATDILIPQPGVYIRCICDIDNSKNINNIYSEGYTDLCGNFYYTQGILDTMQKQVKQFSLLLMSSQGNRICVIKNDKIAK